MGAKPSIKIETPQFRQTDWQYQAPEDQHNPQYGIYRTLSNKETGQLIDEYDMTWFNQDEYNYYLRSFNWRYNQPNVVNTRFIVQKSRQQFCSQTYVARVYIQHMIVRLSQINDIPFPQNLYVLMQSLQGYAKIYEHSKYFIIDEDQICVDAWGNVKIWVNSDLSINYPTADRYEDDKNAGEEAMVERLIEVIAGNTDRQTQPQMSFLDYYKENKGFKGKKFEEARVLVLTYARLYETQIPDKFDSVMNLGREEQETQQEEQNLVTYQLQNQTPTPQWDQLNHHNHYPAHNQDLHRPISQPIAMIPPPQTYHFPMHVPQNVVPYQVYPTAEPIPTSYQPISTISFGPKSYLMRNVPFRIDSAPQQVPIARPFQQIPLTYNHIQTVPSPIIPLQIQQILFQSEVHKQSNTLYRQSELKNRRTVSNQQTRRTRPKDLQIVKRQSVGKLNQLDSPVNIKINSLDAGDIRVTLYNNNDDFIAQNPQPQRQYSEEEQNQVMFIELPSNSIFPIKLNQNKNIHKERDVNAIKTTNKNFFFTQNVAMNQVDDMLAKSLPLKAEYHTNKNNQLLPAFGQSDRSVHSHILTKQHVDSFGLAGSGHKKLKESGLEINGKVKQKLADLGSTVHKNQNKVIQKYYYSLQEELQIDPDIAADMARYLAT